MDWKLYLSAVFDCYDGTIVGMAMDNNMRAELVNTAFLSACKRYNARNMVFYSDRGSQFTSGFLEKLWRNMNQSKA